MSKPFAPCVITANDLLVGDVIYLSLTDWTRDLAQAEIFTDEAVAEDRLIEAAQSGDVVDVYLAKMDPVGPTPAHFREAFRAKGPSNYAHGKQEIR